MDKRPNILWFVADQMRSDSMHHLGNEASITPNLDSLSNEGVSFKNAYCQNPVCVPSRCSFLTGLYPHTTGHRTMHYLQRGHEPNILKEMKNQGYEVIWIGRNDVIPSNVPKNEYCDEYHGSIISNTNKKSKASKLSLEMLDYSFYVGKLDNVDKTTSGDWRGVQALLDYLDRKSKQQDSKPFFVYCTLFYPHPPYACEEPWYSSIDHTKLPKRRPNIDTLKDKASMLYGIYNKQDLGSWPEEKFDEIRATYLAMVSRFDYQFGMVLNKLKSLDFYDDTSVFFFSDHGDYTCDYGIVEKTQNTFEDPLSNIPLLVKPAKCFNVKPGINEALVELIDLPATLADMASFDLSYTQFGKSLLPTLEGKDQNHKDAVFCEGGRIHGESQAMESGHKPKSPYWPRLSTQESEGPEHTKAIMCRMGNYKYIYRLYEKDELYDLNNDSYETINLADNEKYQNQTIIFQQRILKFMVETGDFVPMGKDLR